MRAIHDADRAGAWAGQGHRDHASLLAARYSVWRARRLIAAAFALEHLPRTAEALESGRIGLDKVVELTRFATAENESHLVEWAMRASSGAVRNRADVESRNRDEAASLQRSRSLTWAWQEGRSWLYFEGSLPPDEGARLEAAVNRLAKELPDEPSEDGSVADPADSLDRRRADALVLLTTATESGHERSTLVVHAPLESLRAGEKDAATPEGSPIPATTAQRLACDSNVEVVLYGEQGQVAGIGRRAHDPPAWLRRQVLRRDDHACSFPGCGMRRYLHVHHVRWWREGGETNLDNLLTLCHFHHKLVHEYGWRVRLDPDGTKSWFRPGGEPYGAIPAGPDPPDPPPTDDFPWGSFWHALKTADTENTDGFFMRWSLRRGVDWIPADPYAGA